MADKISDLTFDLLLNESFNLTQYVYLVIYYSLNLIPYHLQNGITDRLRTAKYGYYLLNIITVCTVKRFPKLDEFTSVNTLLVTWQLLGQWPCLLFLLFTTFLKK